MKLSMPECRVMAFKQKILIGIKTVANNKTVVLEEVNTLTYVRRHLKLSKSVKIL
jgi:hypothetical protein